MRRFFLALASVLFSTAFLSNSQAASISYTFTEIFSDSSGQSVSIPGINNNNEVVFTVFGLSYSVLAGDEQQLNEVASIAGGDFVVGGQINDRGEVLLLSSNGTENIISVAFENGIREVFRHDPSASGVGEADFNNLGDVVFTTEDADRNYSIEIIQADGTRTEVTNTLTSEFTSFGFGFDRSPTINDEGQVAFFASTPAGGTIQLYVDGEITQLFTEHLLGQPQINNNAQVSVFARTLAGLESIVLLEQLGVTTIDAFSSDLKGPVGAGFSFEPSLNDNGDVAYTTSGNAPGTRAIKASIDGMITTILTTGDSLDDRVIASLFLSDNGLNNEGSVAFLALFEDGSEAIFRADITAAPIPLPAGAPLLLIGLIAFRIVSKDNKATHSML